jgi:trigger factor
VQAQAIEQFGDQVFEQGLEESGLEPIAQASLQEVTWEPTMALHLTVPVGPEVDLGAYQDVRVPWQAPEVTEEDVEEELARLQKQHAEEQASEKPAELGDQIVADITATVEGEVVLENTGRELVLDAESPYPAPGFSEAVVGMQAGETREFALTYPEDHYNADIAGKEGHFEVHVTEVKTEVLPELDDEFAIMVGDYEDLDDLKAKVRQSLQESAESAAESEFEEAMWQELLEVAEIEYPEVYVDREVEMMQSQFGSTLQRQGMDLDTFFQLTNSSEEKWRAEIRPQAIEQMKRRLILAEVVHDQELAVDDDEIKAEIKEALEPLGEQADEMRELLESENGRLSIEDSLLRQKAMEYLKSVVRVEAEAGEEADEETETTEASAEEEVVEEAEEEKAVADEASADEASADEADDELVEMDTEQPEQELVGSEEAGSDTEVAEDEVETEAPEATGQDDKTIKPLPEAETAEIAEDQAKEQDAEDDKEQE